MELQTIQAIIAAFQEASLTTLFLKCQDFELKLAKESTTSMGPNRTVELEPRIQIPSDKIPVQSQQEHKEQKCIKAPIVGTFYTAADPKAQPMISVGSKVKKGDVVCIIEAMKLMNEVEAEVDGEVIEVLVANEDMVEYGQPLFILK